MSLGPAGGRELGCHQVRRGAQRFWNTGCVQGGREGSGGPELEVTVFRPLCNWAVSAPRLSAAKV